MSRKLAALGEDTETVQRMLTMTTKVWAWARGCATEYNRRRGEKRKATAQDVLRWAIEAGMADVDRRLAELTGATPEAPKPGPSTVLPPQETPASEEKQPDLFV